jgi:plastocyanin domain-containing protein
MKKTMGIIISLMLGSFIFAHEGSHGGSHGDVKKEASKQITNKQKTAVEKITSQKTVKVEISEDGFKPANIKVNKGEDLVLLVTRKTDKTCMKELKNLDGSGQVKLPLNKEVKFEVGSSNKSGDVKILCGMDMTAGVITVL